MPLQFKLGLACPSTQAADVGATRLHKPRSIEITEGEIILPGLKDPIGSTKKGVAVSTSNDVNDMSELRSKVSEMEGSEVRREFRGLVIEVPEEGNERSGGMMKAKRSDSESSRGARNGGWKEERGTRVEHG